MTTQSNYSEVFGIIKNFASILFEEKSPEEIKANEERKIRFQVVDNEGNPKFITSEEGYYNWIKEKNLTIE